MTTLKVIHSNLRSSFSLLLWSVFPILFPFYVLPSGLPQPGTILMIAAMGLLFLNYGLSIHRELKTPVVTLLIFIFYTFLVGWGWDLMLINEPSTTQSTLIPPIYYLYNFLIFLSVLVAYKRFGDAVLTIITHAVALSIFLQLVLTPFSFSELSRQVLFFNNPNQLGYYCLICATVFAIGNGSRPTNFLYQGAFYIAIIFLTSISLSKAAILGVGMLMLLQARRKAGVLVVSALFLAAVIGSIEIGQDTFNSLADRFNNIGHASDDNFAARGYDRIANHPEYWIFGAAEGAYSRFDSVTDNEMHSTWGTLFFAYGIVGCTIVMTFLFQAYRTSRTQDLICLAPVAFYGITHQGLRASLLWLLLAFVVCVGMEAHQLRQRQARNAGATGRRHRLANRNATFGGSHNLKPTQQD